MLIARHCLLFLLLIVAIYTDLAEGKIYNWCTLPAIFVGLLLNFVIGGWLEGGWTAANLATSVAGLVVVGLVFGWPYLRGGIAAGDIKLMFAVAAIGGLREYFTLYAVFYSVLIGALMALMVFIWRGRLWEGLKGAVRLTFSTGRIGAEEESENDQETESEGPQHTGLTIPYGVAIAIGSVIAWYIVELPGG